MDDIETNIRKQDGILTLLLNLCTNRFKLTVTSCQHTLQ